MTEEKNNVLHVDSVKEMFIDVFFEYLDTIENYTRRLVMATSNNIIKFYMKIVEIELQKMKECEKKEIK